MRLIIEINESKDAGGIFLNGKTEGSETATNNEKQFTGMLIQTVGEFATAIAGRATEAKITEAAGN